MPARRRKRRSGLSRRNYPLGLAMLDMSLHGERDAGLEVCRTIGRLSSDVPILIPTSQDDETDRIAGLQAGATDHMSKGESLEDVVSRIEALLADPS
jgi:DNA-binding response OmpR family regulator